jgi:hypothetical protein
VSDAEIRVALCGAWAQVVKSMNYSGLAAKAVLNDLLPVNGAAPDLPTVAELRAALPRLTMCSGAQVHLPRWQEETWDHDTAPVEAALRKLIEDGQRQ